MKHISFSLYVQHLATLLHAEWNFLIGTIYHCIMAWHYEQIQLMTAALMLIFFKFFIVFHTVYLWCSMQYDQVVRKESFQEDLWSMDVRSMNVRKNLLFLRFKLVFIENIHDKVKCQRLFASIWFLLQNHLKIY